MNALEKYAAKRLLIEKLAVLGGLSKVVRSVMKSRPGQALSKSRTKLRNFSDKNPAKAAIGSGLAGGTVAGTPFVVAGERALAERGKSPFFHRKDVSTAREGRLPKPGTLRAGELTEKSFKDSKLRREAGYLDFHDRQSVPRTTSGN